MERRGLWYELRVFFYVWQSFSLNADLSFFSTDFQADGDLLKTIDTLKASAKIPSVDILRHMTVRFTQQSCAIEGNTLGLSDTQNIWDSLVRDYNLDDFLKDSEAPFPVPSSLSD